MKVMLECLSYQLFCFTVLLENQCYSHYVSNYRKLNLYNCHMPWVITLNSQPSKFNFLTKYWLMKKYRLRVARMKEIACLYHIFIKELKCIADQLRFQLSPSMQSGKFVFNLLIIIIIIIIICDHCFTCKILLR